MQPYIFYPLLIITFVILFSAYQVFFGFKGRFFKELRDYARLKNYQVFRGGILRGKFFLKEFFLRIVEKYEVEVGDLGYYVEVFSDTEMPDWEEENFEIFQDKKNKYSKKKDSKKKNFKNRELVHPAVWKGEFCFGFYDKKKHAKENLFRLWPFLNKQLKNKNNKGLLKNYKILKKEDLKKVDLFEDQSLKFYTNDSEIAKENLKAMKFKGKKPELFYLCNNEYHAFFRIKKDDFDSEQLDLFIRDFIFFIKKFNKRF
jgi:hypothetical protein